MSAREHTYSSPFNHAVKPEVYSKDSQVQHDLLRNSFDQFVLDPFEKSTDLRGHKFEVVMHMDGMHVTVRHINFD